MMAIAIQETLFSKGSVIGDWWFWLQTISLLAGAIQLWRWLLRGRSLLFILMILLAFLTLGFMGQVVLQILYVTAQNIDGI